MTRIEEFKFLSGIRSGQREYESVLVRSLDGGLMRVLHSPLFGPNLAAGDYIRRELGSEQGFTHVLRGGNVCIQVLAPNSRRIGKHLDRVKERLVEIGGWPDGSIALTRNRIAETLTVPVAAGFDEIDTLFAMVEDVSGIHMQFGNVYDYNDGKTPLCWWKAIDAPADERDAHRIQADRRWQEELGEALDSSERQSVQELNVRGLLGLDYELDWDSGLIQFSAPDGLRRARFEAAGSFSHSEGTWLWAYGNDSLKPVVKSRVIGVMEEGKRRSIGELATPEWPATLTEAEEMIAFAFRHVGAKAWIKQRAGDELVTGLLVTEWLDG